jgi:phage/plasmid-associated DNA primase
MTDVEKADPLVKPRDTEIQDRLTTEENLSAWLLVMVEAFERLESEGWSHEETQKELWESYQGEADTIWSFLDECVECSYGARFSDDTPIHLTVDDLHQMAASYHRANGKTLEMSAAQFGKQINKMGVHEMINFESRKTGKVRSRKWLHPKGEGWTHATRDVIQRFETECDEIDVPAPTNDNNNGGNGAMSESGRVLRAIQTQMMRDSGGPTLATLAGACKLGPDATRAALGELMVDGTVEKCGDEYHTAAVADGGDVDE